MRVINNKYNIKDKLREFIGITEYSVIEIETNKIFSLYICNNEIMTNTVKKYLINNFKSIRNLNCNGVSKLYELINISVIDGINLEKTRDAFLGEFIEDSIDIEDYINKTDFEEKMGLFMDIAIKVNTMNKKGYIYSNLELNHIELTKRGNSEVKVILPNVLAIELSNLDSFIIEKNTGFLKENILFNEKKCNIRELLKIYTEIFKNDYRNNEFNNIVNMQINNEYCNEGFKDIGELINYVNKSFDKRYPKFYYNSVNKIQNDIDIVGRDVEINSVIKDYNNMLYNKSKSKCIIFNGVVGIGKSKLLSSLHNRLKYIYDANILKIPSIDKVSELEEKKKNILNDIKKKINYDYEEFFNEFLDAIKLKRKTYNISEMKKYYKIMSSCIKIIEEYSKSEPLVIIIDDLEKQNMFVKMNIKHIMAEFNRINNVLIICTIESYDSDNDLRAMVDSLKDDLNISEYKLNLLNQYYTKEMIQKLLNTNNEIDEISSLIHRETLGNPTLIKEKIDHLYKNYNLYISGENGNWIGNFKKEVGKIPMAIEKSYENKFNMLEDDESNVLKRMSIINNPMEEGILLKSLLLDKKEEYAYYRLKEEGILLEKFDDKGITVDFSDMFYKRIIYKKINKFEKNKLHKECAKFLQCMPDEDIYYKEELIYQLEKSNQHNKMIEEGFKYGEYATKSGYVNKAIDIYKIIFKYSLEDRKGIIAFDIASLYLKIEEYTEALKYYDISKKFGIDNNDNKLIIDSLIFSTYIRIEIEKYEEVNELLNVIKVYLYKQDYKYGNAYHYYLKALYLYKCGRKSEAINEVNACVNLCNEKDLKIIKAKALLLLFNKNIEEEKYSKVSEDISYCLSVFKENRDVKEYLNTLLKKAMFLIQTKNNLQDGYNIISEVYAKSRIRKIPSLQFKCLVHLSNIKLYQYEYNLSSKYMNDALALAKSNKSLERYIGLVYLNLIYIALMKGELSSAIKLKQISEQFELNYAYAENYIIDVQIVNAKYYYYIENYERCIQELDLIKNNIKNINTLSGIRNRIDYYLMCLIEVENEDIIKQRVKELIEISIKYNDEKYIINAVVDAIKLIFNKGYHTLAKTIAQSLEKNPDINLIDEKEFVLLKMYFMDNNANVLINKALRLINLYDNERDSLKLYYLIAAGYEKNDCHMLACEYYYEALMLSFKLIKLQKGKDRISYANSKAVKNLLEVFTKCLSKNFNINLNLNPVFNSEEDINEVFQKIRISNLLSFHQFKNKIIKNYEKCYYNNYGCLEEVVKNFNSDILKNIEAIIKHIAYITLSTSAILNLNSENGENNTICSYRVKENLNIDRKLNQRINTDSLIINSEDIVEEGLAKELLSSSLKSCMFFRLKNKNSERIKNRYKGQLILLSDKSINNINNESRKEIKKIEPILVFLLDQYNLMISSTRDKLTGAYNRAYFEKEFNEVIDYSTFENDTFSLVIFDIDNFKGVNDKFGHPVGDRVLQDISSIVKKSIGKKDIFARYGGEEFVIIFPGKNIQKAYMQAENIRSRVEVSDLLRGKRELTISMGISNFPKHSKDRDDLLKKADQALYEAKHRNKNIVKIWDDEYTKEIEPNDKLSGILSGNMANDYDKVASLIEIISIVRDKIDKQKKVYRCLNRIVEVTKSSEGYLLFIDNDKISNIKRIKRGKAGWAEIGYFNLDKIKEVKLSKKGLYTLDFDEITAIRNLSTIPKWHSICIVPLINKGIIKGVLYLSVPAVEKEFDSKDFNYINTLGDILSILI